MMVAHGLFSEGAEPNPQVQNDILSTCDEHEQELSTLPLRRFFLSDSMIPKRSFKFQTFPSNPSRVLTVPNSSKNSIEIIRIPDSS